MKGTEKFYCNQGHPATPGPACGPCDDECAASGHGTDCEHARDFAAKLRVAYAR